MQERRNLAGDILKPKDEKKLEEYLNGLMPESEARLFEQRAETDESLFEGIDPSNKVGDMLRSIDPSAGLFEDIDLTQKVNEKLFPAERTISPVFKKLLAASVAAAILVAFLATCFIPVLDKPDFTYTVPSVAHADGIEYLAPNSATWKVLTAQTSISPGFEIRSNSKASTLAFSDGSSMFLRDGTCLEIGGTEDKNYSFKLMRGEIRADFKGTLFSIATDSTDLRCREGLFVLYSDNLLNSPPSLTDSCHTFASSASNMVILTVALGTVSSESEQFIEGSRRDWPYEQHENLGMASLK